MVLLVLWMYIGFLSSALYMYAVQFSGDTQESQFENISSALRTGSIIEMVMQTSLSYNIHHKELCIAREPPHQILIKLTRCVLGDRRSKLSTDHNPQKRVPKAHRLVAINEMTKLTSREVQTSAHHKMRALTALHYSIVYNAHTFVSSQSISKVMGLAVINNVGNKQVLSPNADTYKTKL
uniref:Uncharacterized protein n=1 Tax=Glossina pallidipes TaxID=7398 RepID=A0A1A9ZA73_GLOPL